MTKKQMLGPIIACALALTACQRSAGGPANAMADLPNALTHASAQAQPVMALTANPTSALAEPGPTFMNGELLFAVEFNGSEIIYDTCATTRDLTSLFAPNVRKSWQPTATGFILRLSFEDEMTGVAHTTAFRLERASNAPVNGGICSGRSAANEVVLTRIVQDGEDLGPVGLKYWADKATRRNADQMQAAAPSPPPPPPEPARCDDYTVTDRLIALMKRRTPAGFPEPTVVLSNGASEIGYADSVRTCRARMGFNDSPADIRTVTYTVAFGQGGAPEIETQSVTQ